MEIQLNCLQKTPNAKFKSSDIQSISKSHKDSDFDFKKKM